MDTAQYSGMPIVNHALPMISRTTAASVSTEAVLYFAIDEDVLGAPTKHDLYKRLLKAGPSSVRIENYEDFCKRLEGFIE